MNDDEFSQKVVEAFSIVSSSLFMFSRIERRIVKEDDMALDIDNIFEEVSFSPLITTLSGPGSGIIDTSNDHSASSDVDKLTAQLANAATIMHYLSKVYSYENAKVLNDAARVRVSESIHSTNKEFPSCKGAYLDASKRQYTYKNRPRLASAVVRFYLLYLDAAKEANKLLEAYNSDHRDNQLSDLDGHTSIPEK
jgi:hypothetical protein